MAQQRNAYSMALQASVAAEQPIVVREQQQFIDAEDEAVRIEPVAITSINVDVPTAANGVFIGDEIEIANEHTDGCGWHINIDDRKSTRLNSNHFCESRMPSSD